MAAASKISFLKLPLLFDATLSKITTVQNLYALNKAVQATKIAN